MRDLAQDSHRLRFTDALEPLFSRNWPAPVEGALGKLLLFDRLDEIYREVTAMDAERPFCDRLLEVLQVHPVISQMHLDRIPKSGPVLLVANHPFGIIEGVILAALLPPIRPDLKIMANFLLSITPDVSQYIITVDPFGGEDSVKGNLRGLKESIRCLKKGGMLAVFPAGEVAHVDFRTRQITDPPWSEMIGRIARTTGASVLPVYFDGNNSALFQILGVLHPLFRTVMLPHEFLNKQHTTIEVRIGNPISPKKIESLGDDAAIIRYARQRTYLLKDQDDPRDDPHKLAFTAFFKRRPVKAGLEPVIPAVPAHLLEAEIGGLAEGRRLAESGEFSVLLARAHQIPNVLRELGRLREVTFRAAGEGTGKPLDIDSYDAHYLHLFIWNKAKNEIVGAYRLGQLDEILNRFGKKGLYTSAHFAYKRSFLERISPALEMGRSFVRQEYQKNYAPLLLLWKGIGQYVSQHPQYKILFGPVSISNGYKHASRQLIVEFLQAFCQSDDLARLVRARSPFRGRLQKGFDGKLDTTADWDIEELSTLIADIETDHKGVPILLKQYLKLGGKLAAYNVDANFSDALDGLIVVDLTKTDHRVLERYMGKDAALAFLKFHARSSVA